MILDSLLAKERAKYHADFLAYCKENKLSCKKYCKAWNFEDGDCELYGENHPKLADCYLAFMYWFDEIYKK